MPQNTEITESLLAIHNTTSVIAVIAGLQKLDVTDPDDQSKIRAIAVHVASLYRFALPIVESHLGSMILDILNRKT